MDTYLITGASSDIGIAFLRKLEHMEKPMFALCQYYKNKEELEKLKNNFSYVKIQCFSFDLSKENSVLSWIEEIEKAGWSPTHILHLAAQSFEYMRLRNFDWERTSRQLLIQVNVLAQLCKKFLPEMAKRHRGKIVVVLSSYTLGVPPKFMSDYIITKYALLGLMKSIASEYGGRGISINGISPSIINTKFIRNIDSRILELNAEESVMKRNITCGEVADSICFLMSEASDYMNGVNINLTGGNEM